MDDTTQGDPPQRGRRGMERDAMLRAHAGSVASIQLSTICEKSYTIIMEKTYG
jgi:hypothetical protein